MANSQAPNLTTIVQSIPPGSVAVLKRNSARTFMALANVSVDNTADLRWWVGPLAPPIDTSEWPPALDTTILHEGVMGPVYLAEAGNKASRVAVVSSLTEAGEGRTLLDKETFCVITELTTNDGTLLTDDLDLILYVCT